MRDKLVRKGLVIGVIVLFVCINLSSAVAIKGVKLNNNDKINSSNVESTEDLPDLKIISIETETWWFDEPWYEIVQFTEVRIKNIGDASFNGYVNIIILVYHGIGIFSYLHHTFIPEIIELDIAPGDVEKLTFAHEDVDDVRTPFCKFVVYVNYDKNVKESDYRNNVAQQKFYIPLLLRGQYWNYPIFYVKIGFIRYPLLLPHQLGI